MVNANQGSSRCHCFSLWLDPTGDKKKEILIHKKCL